MHPSGSSTKSLRSQKPCGFNGSSGSPAQNKRCEQTLVDEHEWPANESPEAGGAPNFPLVSRQPTRAHGSSPDGPPRLPHMS